jgi:hypothetical protein
MHLLFPAGACASNARAHTSTRPWAMVSAPDGSKAGYQVILKNIFMTRARLRADVLRSHGRAALGCLLIVVLKEQSSDARRLDD